MAKFLLIDSYNFEGYPTGGSGTFCDQLIESFGNDVALIGITTSINDTIGFWGKKIINGIEYDYFPVKYSNKQYNRKPFIPARIKWFFALRKYRMKIVNFGCNNVFIQSPDTLLAIYKWKLKNICYSFAGLANPLSMSRYKWARTLDTLLEDIYIPKLKYVSIFLAAASKIEIEDYTLKVCKYEFKINISQFPTRVNTDIFYPKKKNEELRKSLSYRNESIIIVTSGRLSEVKGWRLLLDSFNLFLKDYPDSYLIFVGNGQDKSKIEAYVKYIHINNRVKLVGFQTKECLSNFLNIADLYVMGSLFEGWPTSMIEALACGIPICSTNFGSAKEIINSEKFGMIVNDRYPETFALQMKCALNIEYDEKCYLNEIKKYATNSLKDDLLKYWQLQ